MTRPRKRRTADHLGPLTKKKKTKSFGTLDLESKAGDTEKGGFERPFVVGVYDPFHPNDPSRAYKSFRNERHLAARPWDLRHTLPGGCIDKTMTWILHERFRGYTFYAHNGGKFDYLFLLAWLRLHEEDFAFELVPIQSSIQALRVWPKDEDPEHPSGLKWEFLDSMKLIPMSLKKACESFKVRDKDGNVVGKYEQDYDLPEDHPSWETYLKQDCVALATVMQRFYDLVESEDKLDGEVGITTPSTSMKLFRRKFLGQEDVPKYVQRFRHWDTCEDPASCGGCSHEWYRKGYYGGRTELHADGREMWTPEQWSWFRKHDDERFFDELFQDGLPPDEEEWTGPTCSYFDINSSYVATMREDMPTGERIVDLQDEMNWSRHDAGSFGGFVECTVEIPEDCKIPPLPHPDPKTGKLLFPAGRFHGVWPTCELALLRHPLVRGRIVYVRRAVWHRMQPMFRQMVDKLWAYRDKKRTDYDEGMSTLAKLLGNSLYGKFGMKQQRTAIVIEKEVEGAKCFLCGNSLATADDEEDPVDGQPGICWECEGSKPASLDLDGDVWYQQKRVDAPYIIPQIAAWITGRARVRLWEFMAQIVEKGGKLYYTDTDSVITDLVMPSSTELGAFKDEYGGERLRYLGVAAKCYMVEPASKNQELRRMRAAWEELRNGPSPDLAILREKDPKGEGGDYRRKPAKVTMKGFPPSARTPENLASLRNGEVLHWERLEQVRTLARGALHASPKVVPVEKSLVSKYDKRVLHPDGTTTPRIVYEPVGGLDAALEEESDLAAEE